MGVLLEPVDPKVLQRVAKGFLRLSPRKVQILRVVLTGVTYDRAAAILGMKHRTLETHMYGVTTICGCDRYMLARLAPDLERIPAVVEHVTNPPNPKGGRPKRHP